LKAAFAAQDAEEKRLAAEEEAFIAKELNHAEVMQRLAVKQAAIVAAGKEARQIFNDKRKKQEDEALKAAFAAQDAEEKRLAAEEEAWKAKRAEEEAKAKRAEEAAKVKRAEEEAKAKRAEEAAKAKRARNGRRVRGKSPGQRMGPGAGEIKNRGWTKKYADATRGVNNRYSTYDPRKGEKFNDLEKQYSNSGPYVNISKHYLLNAQETMKDYKNIINKRGGGCAAYVLLASAVAALASVLAVVRA
jgi:membrane protein involved in colicin uptake